MIVVDASAVLELLLLGPQATAVRDRLFANEEFLAAPHLLDLEIVQVLRRLALRQSISHDRAGQALDDLAAMRITRYAHLPLLRRIWSLSANLTAYDAAYLALAEVLDAGLVTCDSAFRAVPGSDVEISLIE